MSQENEHEKSIAAIKIALIALDRAQPSIGISIIKQSLAEEIKYHQLWLKKLNKGASSS